MLSRLHIKNFAIIDQLDIELSPGLNIITGETGAGKSILVGALSLLLGQRADTHSLFRNEGKCSIEGFFQIGNYNLKAFFEENDLDFDSETSLRREISSEGKSRAFVNDSPVSLTILKELGTLLVDIHSQHETLDINTESFQVRITDLVAGQEAQMLSYRTQLKLLSKEEKTLRDLVSLQTEAARESEFLDFQLTELISARLQDPLEQEKLEADLDSLSHAGEIQSGLQLAYTSLDDDAFSVLARLKECISALASAEKHLPGLSELSERLKSIHIEARDISAGIQSQAERISTDPARLAFVQNRLDTLFTLEQKHHRPDLAGLIAYRDELQLKLQGYESSQEQITRLTAEINQARGKLNQEAKLISEARKKAIPGIEKEILQTLTVLGMPDASFKIKQETGTELGAYGCDHIKFLFTANKGFEPGDLGKIASGGELSRLMLAIKGLSSRYMAMPTVIFDEIDTGVSGEVAMKVGRVMESLSKANQVIAITHLPQIASRGEAHYFVYKEPFNGVTRTKLKKLEADERVNEIAKMLSGNEPGEYALKNARELLEST